jgi:hypothetical protein
LRWRSRPARRGQAADRAISATCDRVREQVLGEGDHGRPVEQIAAARNSWCARAVRPPGAARRRAADSSHTSASRAGRPQPRSARLLRSVWANVILP